ncbi:hypothetical protein L7F22_068904 [Adiantum nelumboides]|nr:hypothetical protein [Adiantum nelumboides]
MCSSSRETIMYQSSFFNQDLDKVLRILADTTINPVLSDEELDAQRAAAAWEIDEIWNKPEMIIPELLHSVAYANNTLGNPLLCPVESLEVMKSDNLRDYMRRFYTPPRIVVAGAGMQHELLMELSNRYFGGLEAQQPAAQLIGLSPSSSSPSSSSSSASSPRSSTASSRSASPSMFASSPASSTTSLSSSGPSFDYSTSAALAAQHASKNAIDVPPELQRARYTGGQLYQSRPELDFTHVYVAFEGLAITDPDIYALATLQILLGGGGSFSAGGPGKGMYSRLYSNVLNQFHAVDYCAAFHHCYADSGLFGIAASVQHDFAPQRALAGNPFAGLDRAAIARDLGFATVGTNSMHSVSDRDFVVETLMWASLTMIHISKMAEDLIIYSSAEFGFVQLSDAYSTGSSIMPQKKNPDSLELLRGKSGRVFGQMSGFMMTLKGIPSTYNKDLQEDKEPLFDAVDTVRRSLQIATGVISTMSTFPERMRSALTPDMLATDLAEYLVRKGIPFRETHHVSGSAVRLSEERKCSLSDLTVKDLQSLHPAFEDDVLKVWSFDESVERRDATGGTSKRAVLEQCDRLEASLAK